MQQRTFIAYGFAISLLLHALALPFARAQPTYADEQRPRVLHITELPTPPPTPVPTPRPTPTPRAVVTPPPRHPAGHRIAHRLKIVVAHATAHGDASAAESNRYRTGDAFGAPSAPATAGPPTNGDASPAPPAAASPPAPPATPTPRSCARPNVAATTLRTVEPEMPPLATAQGVSGTVAVVVSLDANSRVVNARVQSSPSALLNAAALTAARGSAFRTETRDCVPIAADYLFTVDFSAQ
ncbi:MAG TPA: TonB family protein [Candidatus Elarobacter sp.]|jgi:TonB family protein|nr:TonB family protein [Candidatus Elarobacter sp.]